MVWEIPSLDRDKVTGLSFGYSLPRMFPKPGDQTIFYLDQLELQKVVPDYVEGWDVAPGKDRVQPRRIRARDDEDCTGQQAFCEPVFACRRSHGKDGLHNGSVEDTEDRSGEISGPGFLAGATSWNLPPPRRRREDPRPFRIGTDVWRDSIWKVINFMYSERCGTVIPGIHDVCHQDDYTVHGDQRIVVNGGYHDAGDTERNRKYPGDGLRPVDASRAAAARERRSGTAESGDRGSQSGD